MSRWLKNRKSGFTMIELMVVVIIVAILSAIAVPLYTGYIKNSRKSEATARLGAETRILLHRISRVCEWFAIGTELNRIAIRGE